ncbi:MAG TPA: hypothetical protein VHU23_04640 [Rhizomicrobium sp.]|jgi:hypothetical protein|nr:hypothetical protein [Rhizomicrobium sp.]
MKYVNLDRVFTVWNEADETAVDRVSLFGSTFGSLSWAKLLGSQRVVILAEAGSGKSTEFHNKTLQLTGDGKYAFSATVQDVARDGLESALGPKQRSQFLKWLKSDQPAHFFVDSIDEAKHDKIRFATALRRLADGIDAAKGRVHIILSGRISDWEKARDLASFTDILPLPKAVDQSDGSSPDDELVQILNHSRKRRDEKKEEKHLIVAMSALNQDRVRIYATAREIESVDDFIAAIDSSNLWMFARRPADLDSLIAYWKTHQRFGSLAEMIDLSIRERLKEPERSGADEIPAERAILALERIGAALAFGRVDRLTIPDPDQNSEVNLTEILPDWSPNHIQRLLSRAIFDPATFGTVRLHGDNEGVVRSFLAARWLLRRQQQPGFSKGDLRDLLFSNTYGLKLVKPSLHETAAWLALWNPDIANETIDRNPFILLLSGDPASLTAATRAAALRNSVERIAHGDDRLGWRSDVLRRFATPDLLAQIKSLYAKYKTNERARVLLVQLLALGKLTGADEIIDDAVFGTYEDTLTRTFGGRVLLAVSSDAIRTKYAAKVASSPRAFPSSALWDALENMFLQEIGVADLFKILDELEVGAEKDAQGFSHYGPKLVEKATARRDIELLLAESLKRLGPPVDEHRHEESPLEEAYRPAILTAAGKALGLAGQNEIPPDVIAAAFRLGERQRFRNRDESLSKFTNELRSTSARRRLMFWQAQSYFSDSKMMHGSPLTNVAQLEFLGWRPGFQLEDVEWLLADLKAAESDDDRALALNAALHIWRDNERPTDLIDQIRPVADSFASTRGHVEAWINPQPSTASERDSLASLEQTRKIAEDQRLQRDQSWIDLLAQLRANPECLRRFQPPRPGDVDNRLYNLWLLLSVADSHSSRYAIESVEPLRHVLGDALAAELRKALINFWRGRSPQLESERAPDKKNTINSLDCMGVAGISLEAKSDPKWATRLTGSEATSAARFATLELNGFPFWFQDLIANHPCEVSQVLMHEIRADLENNIATVKHGILQDIVYSPPAVAENVAGELFKELRVRTELDDNILDSVLTIISTGLKSDLDAFCDFSLERFDRALKPESAALYVSAAFTVNPTKAIDALAAKLDTSDRNYQRTLAEHLLPNLFGDGMLRRRVERPNLPLETLAKLTKLAFQTVPINEDRQHQSGVVYSPDNRDNAERARSYAFKQLVSIPGYQTYSLLNYWANTNEIPDFPAHRLHELAFERAAADSEHSAWPLSEPYALEHELDVAPSTPDDLQRCALRRIEDIQDDLHNTDFAQGRTLKRLKSETEVQLWVAAQLKHLEKRAYSVERESEVVDGKAPDIRLRAKRSASSLPIEIKVAEDNTLEQLENALKVQLVGRYLRDRDANRGILLVVHKESRPSGWAVGRQRMLTFSQVVEHLRALADEMATGPSDAPQAKIAVLDVSSIVIKDRAGKATKQSRRVH